MAAQLNDRDRALIMADYHSGATQSTLAAKYEVSVATINKLCKGVERKFLGKISELVNLKSEFIEKSEIKVNSLLLDETPIEANAIRNMVNQKALDLQYFRHASLLISEKVLDKVKNEDLSMFDLEKAQNVIGKGKDNIYGKMPDTAVQVNTGATTYRWESDDE